MGCTNTKQQQHEIPTNGKGNVYNRRIKKPRKFRSGLHVEKTLEMGAEANFQAAVTTDIDEVYTPLLSQRKNNNSTKERIPSNVLENVMVNEGLQTEDENENVNTIIHNDISK